MALVTNRCKALLAQGDLDLVNDDIRVALCEAAFTPDADHNFLNQITNECAGTGYARTALAGKTVTEDDTNDRAVFDATDPSWAGANFGTPAHVVVYKHVTNDADSPVLFVLDITSPVATNGGTFGVTFSANGIARLS